MNSLKDSFINWFGYTRKERRSAIILLNLIFLVIGVRYFVPSEDISIREIPVELTDQDTTQNVNTFINNSSGARKQDNVKQRKKTVINLNKCDSAMLVSLPGIGPVLSSRIIKYRKLIGGFANTGQLKEVYGLPEETFNLISSRVNADTVDLRKIRINKAEFKELIRHPYFKKGEVASILKFREISGSISGIDEMIRNNLVSAETAKKIGVYLDFGKD